MNYESRNEIDGGMVCPGVTTLTSPSIHSLAYVCAITIGSIPFDGRATLFCAVSTSSYHASTIPWSLSARYRTNIARTREGLPTHAPRDASSTPDC